MSEHLVNVAAATVAYGALATDYSTKQPKKPVDEYAKTTQSTKHMYWGDNDDLPDQFIKAMEHNETLGAAIDLQARLMYAGGLDYDLVDPMTDLPLEKPKSPEITSFLRKNWHYTMQATLDFYKFMNFFPQFTVTKDRSKIAWLTAKPANMCRFGVQDNQGNINRCYIRANWSDYSASKKYELDLPIVNPIYDDAERVRARKDGPHYIYGMSYPSGKTYYSIPNWWALKTSKWLDLANKIPVFKMALMSNQVTIKYHIQFPDTHWEFRYPGFSKEKPEKQKELKEKEIKVIVDTLQGAEKAGKTLVTAIQTDPRTKELYPGIKIEAIDDKIKDGIYLEDSAEATIKIFTALGLDPSLLGIIPGKGGSNRSGSDKREAAAIYISFIQMHVDLVLRPLEFVADYNGWNTDTQLVKWRFKKPFLQTLDDVTPSKREMVQPEPGEV